MRASSLQTTRILESMEARGQGRHPFGFHRPHRSRHGRLHAGILLNRCPGGFGDGHGAFPSVVFTSLAPRGEGYSFYSTVYPGTPTPPVQLNRCTARPVAPSHDFLTCLRVERRELCLVFCCEQSELSGNSAVPHHPLCSPISHRTPSSQSREARGQERRGNFQQRPKVSAKSQNQSAEAGGYRPRGFR
jgi:hypothetical protein